MKREGGGWSLPGGREPPSTEQLNARSNGRTVRPAFTIGNIDRMNAGDVENSEGDGSGGYNAGASVVVAELEDGTKFFE